MARLLGVIGTVSAFDGAEVVKPSVSQNGRKRTFGGLIV